MRRTDVVFQIRADGKWDIQTIFQDDVFIGEMVFVNGIRGDGNPVHAGAGGGQNAIHRGSDLRAPGVHVVSRAGGDQAFGFFHPQTFGIVEIGLIQRTGEADELIFIIKVEKFVPGGYILWRGRHRNCI